MWERKERREAYRRGDPSEGRASCQVAAAEGRTARPPPPTRLPPPLTTITSWLGVARSSTPRNPQQQARIQSKPYLPRGPAIRSLPNPSAPKSRPDSQQGAAESVGGQRREHRGDRPGGFALARFDSGGFELNCRSVFVAGCGRL